MSTDLDLKDSLEDIESGRFYLFWEPTYPDDKMFTFSSKLENIGMLYKHDCVLKNKTQVIVLSEPTDARHLTLGPLLVSKIMAHKIMWVSTSSLKYIENK